MEESFEAVLVLYCECVLYPCNPLIAAAQLTKCLSPECEVCFVRNMNCQKHEPFAFGACLLLKLSLPVVPSYILAFFVSCFK